MENTFYLGSYMFAKTENMRELTYVFSGARKTTDGWTLNISLVHSYGYGGGVSTLSMDVKPGDIIRLHPKTKVYVSEPSSFKDKQKLRASNAMRIEQVEADMLKVTFE